MRAASWGEMLTAFLITLALGAAVPGGNAAPPPRPPVPEALSPLLAERAALGRELGEARDEVARLARDLAAAELRLATLRALEARRGADGALERAAEGRRRTSDALEVSRLRAERARTAPGDLRRLEIDRRLRALSLSRTTRGLPSPGPAALERRVLAAELARDRLLALARVHGAAVQRWRELDAALDALRPSVAGAAATDD